MKKSRIAKLALLGASTAALAATLTTSTYAWYVSNKQADMTGGTGNTGTAASDGSVLLSWTGDNDTFFKEITWAEGKTASKVKDNSLSPIHYATASDYGYTKVASPVAGDFSTYYTYSTGAFAAATGAFDSTKTYYTRTGLTAGSFYTSATQTEANAANHIQFSLYVYTEAAKTVTPHLTVTTSKQTANKGQLAYVNDGVSTITGSKTVEGAAVSKGKTFTIDAARALYTMQTVSGSGTGAGSTIAAVNADATGGNAHDYYNAVLEEAPFNVTPTAVTSIGTFDTAAATKLLVTYDIWLEGSDADCFNSCAQWDLDIELFFTVA